MEGLGNLLFYGAAIALYLLVGCAWECIVLPRLIERTVSAHFWHALLALCIGSLVGLGSFWLWPQRLVGVGPPSGISTLLAPTGALLAGALLARAFASRPIQGRPRLSVWLTFDFAFAAALSRLLLVSRAAP